MTNVSLYLLIRTAYDLQDFQIVGGQGWLNADRYDITAKAEGNPNRQQLALMLQTLLADRFKLTAHHETRDLPMYWLVQAKPNCRPLSAAWLSIGPD